MNALITIPLIFAGLTLLWLGLKLFFDYISYRIEKSKKEKEAIATRMGITLQQKQGWFKTLMNHKMQSRLDYSLGLILGIMIMLVFIVAQPLYPFAKAALNRGSLYDNNVDKSVVNLTLQEIPNELNKYIYSIKYSSDDYAGEYTSIFDSIDIRSYGNLKYVLTHEIGHRVWYKILSDAQRAEFEKISKTQQPITDYAKTNVQEDFAESFACYYDYTEVSDKGFGCRVNEGSTARIKWIEANRGTWE